MLLVRDVILSEEIIEEAFVCNLEACKGACCHEGDYGAPLEESEKMTLLRILKDVKPYLTEASKEVLRDKGPFEFFKKPGIFGTSLHADGACVFLIRDKNGIAKCGIEKAYEEGKTDFKKPISCHLYPIRINSNESKGFEAWNYDRWDICNAACTLGKKLKVPIYKFVKEAIIRLKGEDFYAELEEAAEVWLESKSK